MFKSIKAWIHAVTAPSPSEVTTCSPVAPTHQARKTAAGSYHGSPAAARPGQTGWKRGLAGLDRDSQLWHDLCTPGYVDNMFAVPYQANAACFNLARAPHMIIAGATGYGKSVFMDALLVSLLAKNTPGELLLYIADPKRVGFTQYDGLPHLIRREVEPEPITKMLREVLSQMEARYQAMESVGVDDIAKMPIQAARIVVVADEFPEIAETSKEAVTILKRLTLLGRAAGVHVILGVQYPTVAVISTQIKANCPVKICFHLDNKQQSRVVLDCGGAELITGRGDGIIKGIGPAPVSFHGMMVSDEDRKQLFDFLKSDAARIYG